MPYIPHQSKAEVILNGAKNAGELNFLLTRACNNYYNRLVHEYSGAKYSILNDIIGALECAKAEYYRRMVVPYETQKEQENGDVYGS